MTTTTKTTKTKKKNWERAINKDRLESLRVIVCKTCGKQTGADSRYQITAAEKEGWRADTFFGRAYCPAHSGVDLEIGQMFEALGCTLECRACKRTLIFPTGSFVVAESLKHAHQEGWRPAGANGVRKGPMCPECHENHLKEQKGENK